jgi:hypothetical protein
LRQITGVGSPVLRSALRIRVLGDANGCRTIHDVRDRVRVLPGVADPLVTLGPLLRPLIELHWANDSARWTGVQTEDDRLRSHLFGADRTAFPLPIRRGLAEIQNDECFYCGDRLTGRTEVDHFLAWSRWPNDAIENLVVADRCNGAKSDHLAAAEHVTRWTQHVGRSVGDLADLARHTNWVTDPARTRGLVTSTYSHISAGTPLWLRAKEFTLATGPITV